MQTRPENWAAIFAAPHRTEYKAQIAGVEYGSDRIMAAPVITKPLLEKPTIGRVCSATLSIQIRPYDDTTIPKAARVHLYSRLVSATGDTTDWIPQGKYYVSSRSGKTTVTLTCRDDMLKGGVTYIDKSKLDWPATQIDIVNEIVDLMGVELDERTSLMDGAGYIVSTINGDMLMTEVLGLIGACNGGNWVMSETGKLRLIPLSSPAAVPVQELAQAYNGYTDIGDKITISRVTMKDSSDQEYTAGDDSGAELYVECAYANLAVVAALGNSTNGILYGVIYQPFSVEKIYLDPACELGDTITVNSRLGTVIPVVLNSISASCNVGFTCQASALTDAETEDEYPYQTAQELADSRSVKTNKSYYGNTINRDYGFRSMLDNGAYGQFNADGIEFVDEQGKRCLYYDMDAKTFVIDATLGANAIFTNSLYAEQGDVSELRVDQLSTAKHIKKFLLNDTSDDNYILIKDYSIQFISATPAGLYNRILTEDNVQIITENARYLDSEAGGNTSYTQAVNRYGDMLYWEKDIADAVIDDEGYPYIDGIQIFATTEDTGFPVHVFVYDELVKAEYKFEEDPTDGSYAPVQIWGAGTGYADNGKGRIEKTSEMFKIGYTTRIGTDESIELNDDGWIDINKTRKPLSFDFSNIANGSFSETIDGGSEATYKVGFDNDGRITRITDENGHITEVHW
jgi:hypothetical protein